MAKVSSYTNYPGEWLSDPKYLALSPAARGFYRDMVDLIYMEGGGFALKGGGFAGQMTGKRRANLGHILGICPKSATRLLAKCIEAGVLVEEAGVITNPRASKELKKRGIDGHEDCAFKSSKSFKSSKEQDTPPKCPPSAPSGGQGELMPESDPTPRSDSTIQESFEEGWKAWLKVKRKNDQKVAARKSFVKAIARLKNAKRFPTSRQAAEWLAERIRDGVVAVLGVSGSGEVPHLSTWLNQDRFDYDGDGFTPQIAEGRRVRADQGATRPKTPSEEKRAERASKAKAWRERFGHNSEGDDR